jgi:hypothetical protein
MQPSKRVTDRARAAAAVETAALAHAAEAAAGLAEFFADALHPGERLPDFAAYFRLMARTVARRREALAAADDGHGARLAAGAGPRRRRDEAVAALREALVGARSAVVGFFGRGAIRPLLGLQGRVSEDPVALHGQAEQALQALAAAGSRPLPPSRLPGIAWQPETWIAKVAPLHRALGEALAEVGRGRRQAESSHRAKTEALARFDRTVSRVALLVEAHLAAAGREGIAAKVRPRRHRRRKAKAAAEGEPAP